MNNIINCDLWIFATQYELTILIIYLIYEDEDEDEVNYINEKVYEKN